MNRKRALAIWGSVALLAVLLPAVTQRVSAATSGAWAPQPARYGMGEELNLPVTMSDGTVLRASVYFPTGSGGTEAKGRFPVLLQQTPYGKGNIAFGGALSGTDTSYLVQRGYIVVLSDVRGTGDSGGTWGLFDPVEATDGATMARWAARLPHSDGKVGLFGESYMGIDQFLTAAAAGPSSPIKAMMPIISGHDLYSDTVTMGGIPDIEFDAAYIALVGGLNAASPLLESLEDASEGSSSGAEAALSSLASVELSHSESLSSYDLQTLLNVETGGNESFDGSYWAARSPASVLSDIVEDGIPAFLVGGWNDLFQQGEPLNYAALQNLYDGRPASSAMVPGQAVTPRYQLMMGPWEHVTTGDDVNMSAIELEWFDTWLLGQDTPLAHTTTPLHLYELQSGSWINSRDWPLAGARATSLYFGAGSSGTDPLSRNDGTLNTSAPSAKTSGADEVAWLPVSSPCDIQTDQWAAGLPTLGLSLLGAKDACDTNDVTLGAGPDALTYTTAAFTTPKVVSGPIDVTIYATATTSDTELAATVEEVSPSGQSLPLTSGALLGSLRQVDTSGSWYGSDGKLLMADHPYTASSAQPVVPGKVTRYDITVFPTFAEVPAGWRLRVTVTTADTPHLLPTIVQLPHLVGGVYEIERAPGKASYVNLDLAPVSAYSTPCGDLCSLAGP